MDKLTLLAFRTSALGIVSIVFAQTRGKARWTTVRSANDAGFSIGMIDVRCTRAPEYDGASKVWGSPVKGSVCYMEAAVKEGMEAKK